MSRPIDGRREIAPSPKRIRPAGPASRPLGPGMSEFASFDGRSRPASLDGEAADDFLRMVGERVRNARGRKSLSRKAVAERSGISQRYLAQLESGEGNISIALLRRVALTLDVPIDWLICEEDPWASEIVPVMDLYQRASAEQREKVLQILDSEPPNVRRARRVTLIGLRGAGKSTLGRLTANSLGVPFLELNEEIEQASGMPVGEVIAFFGQEGYRRLEQQSVERVAATYEVVVLAVAGGIVSAPKTYDFLLRHFHTIWLRARPEEHMARVRGQGDERPMAGNPAASEELKAILASREALYARAQAHVNTSGRTLEESLDDVLRTIDDNRFLEPPAA